MVLGSLAACTGSRRTPPDTLIVALGSEPTTLDPRFATDANGVRISGLIFNSLIRVGPNFEILPDAAERWTQDKSGYTFYLRRGLRFHNDRLLTADDVAFSFAEFRGPRSPFASNLEALRAVRTGERDGQIFVQLESQSVSTKFLIDLTIVRLLPKAETLAAGAHFQRKPIGTGGFRFVERDINQIRLAAAGLTPGKMPFVIFKVIRDDFTRYQKLLKHEIDIVQTDLPTDKVKDFEARPEEFQVLRYPGLAMTYVLVNFNDPVLKQKPVRLALAQSLNRQEILINKLQGLGQEATSVITPLNPYFNSTLKNPPLDVEAARRAIEQLGVKGSELTLKTSNSPQAIDNGRVLANQFNQTGLNVQMQSYEWATFYDDVKKGNFQLATMRWVGTVDPDIYRNIFHSREAPPGRNRGSYKNPTLDALLDRAGQVDDESKRKALYMDAQKMVHDDLAIIPLWYDTQVAVAGRNIQGYRPEPSSDFYPFLSVSK